jgi:molybdopterin-binding protein
MTAKASLELDLVSAACLVLISRGECHGYELAKQFEVGTTLGHVLTLSRPVVYRAIKTLEALQLVRSIESTGIRGQLKWKLKCTSSGEKIVKKWLGSPVQNLRDLRTEFLIKLLLLQISKQNSKPLIKAQREALKTRIANLLADVSATPISIWRREQARAALRFLDELEGAGHPQKNENSRQLQISARNQLNARVSKVRHGDTLSTVYLAVEPEQTMTSTITRDAADDLALAPGSNVVALFKATEVMIAQSAAEVG